MNMKVYISGKVSGEKIEEVERKFNEAEEMIKQHGCVVINPVKICKSRKITEWESCMKICINRLLMCNAIYLLPGWELSKGARTELNIAKALNYTVISGASIPKYR